MNALRIVCLLLLMNNSCSADGFLAGLLVKTGDELIPIQKLLVGTQIYTWSEVDPQLGRVRAYKERIVDQCVAITIADQCIGAARDQQFLCAKRGWVRACDLQSDDLLVSSSGHLINVENVAIIHEKKRMYAIGLDHNHAYCITSHDIVVHNFLPAIGVGLSFIFGGGGGFSFVGATFSAGIMGLGALVGIKLFKEKDDGDYKFSSINEGGGSASPGGRDPNEDDKKSIQMVHFIIHPNIILTLRVM